METLLCAFLGQNYRVTEVSLDDMYTHPTRNSKWTPTDLSMQLQWNLSITTT